MISGEDVCCSVVFGTLVGVFVFSVMWSELLMTSAMSCSPWSSVYECQRVECVSTYAVSRSCCCCGRHTPPSVFGAVLPYFEVTGHRIQSGFLTRF